MAATSPKRRIQRKNKKRYTFVTFQLDQFDAPFELPDTNHLSLRAMQALNEGDLKVLTDWLRESGVDDDYVDAVLDLEQGEFEEFVDKWTEGSTISVPKSKDS